MEIGSARRKKRNMRDDGRFIYEKGCNNLNLYKIPPTDCISLHEFEEYAIERLKVLKAFETVGIKFIRGSDEYNEAIYKELRKTTLKNITKVNLDEETFRVDHISHFILRLAYCRSEDLRRWFIQQEVDLFKFRFDQLKDKPDVLSTFLKANDLNYLPISADEKDAICPQLIAASGGNAVDTADFYKVPFIEALDLVRGRKVFLSLGYAYVAQKDVVSIILSVFRTHISRALSITAKSLPQLEEDGRLLPILSSMNKRYLGQDYTSANRSVGHITADMIDSLSKKSFPLCMQQLHKELRTSHHLKHGGRMQYGLFLKGIGLTLEEAMKFWREEFVKIMDVDKFDKQYAYNIRHNYGKEGKRTDYTPFSCNKIIMTNTPSQGDHHGCPFRHTDVGLLQQHLNSLGLSKDNTDSVIQYVKGGHYQLACARYFEISHCLNDQENLSFQHPNQYFEESQKLHRGAKEEHKTPSRVIKTLPTSQSSQTPTTQDDLDISGVSDLMDGDF